MTMKIAQNIILALLLITPALSMLAGLAVAPLIGLIIAAAFISFPKELGLKSILRTPLCRIFLCFMLWGLISCLFAPQLVSALTLWGKLLFLMAGGAVALAVSSRTCSRFPIPLYALALAVSVAVEERFTQGFLSTLLHNILGNKDYVYNVTELNRGATILALGIWPAVAILHAANRTLQAFVLFITTCVLLLVLKSLSAGMGMMAGAACFMLVYTLKEKAISGIMAAMTLTILALPVIMTLQNPSAIMQRFPHIPESAEHRLYIWHFASDKALLHPVQGWGLNASRYIPILPSDMLPKNKSPLPLHPHNSVTQLWLELGIPGVLLFAALVIALFTYIRTLPATALYKAACCSGIVAYFTIGLTAYGIWQEWWIASGLLLAFWLQFVPTTPVGALAHATSDRK